MLLQLPCNIPILYMTYISIHIHNVIYNYIVTYKKGQERPVPCSLTLLPVAVCIPVRKKNRPKDRAMQKLRWTKL